MMRWKHAIVIAMVVAGCGKSSGSSGSRTISRAELEKLPPAEACPIIAKQLAACADQIAAKARKVLEGEGKAAADVDDAVARVAADARVPVGERCTDTGAAGFVTGLLPCVGTCEQMAACLTPAASLQAEPKSSPVGAPAP